MKIVFDEILVGERGRAHDVLASTLPDEVAQSLAHHLDLPGQLPPGFELQSYVSGFPQGDRYVFARTSLDTCASRQGMVFSHALVCDLDVVQDLCDVAAVFDSLKAARPPVLFATKTTIGLSTMQTKTQPSPDLCDLLSTPSDIPAVIIDPSALQDIISALWPRLLPDLRREFRFRLSFGPEEADISRLHIVAVPSIIETAWPQARVVDLSYSTETAKTAAGRFLAGQLNGDVSGFLAALSIKCTSFQRLDLCCSAFEMSQVEGDFHKPLAALRLVGSLQPDPTKATIIKASLLKRVSDLPGPESARDFLALRNLDLNPFSQKSDFLHKLTTRFHSLFESAPGSDVLLPIIESAFEPGQSTKDWQQACRNALSELTVIGANALAPLVWMTLSMHPRLGRLLLAQVAVVSSMDDAMCARAGDILVEPSTGLSDDLIASGLVRSEATILIARFNGNLTKALNVACERNLAQFGDYAIRHILGLMEPTELVRASLAVDNPISMSAAAAAVVTEPTILGGHSLNDPRLQAIWAEALKSDSGAWQIRHNIQDLRCEVFDCVLAGRLNSGLISGLVSSPLTNALDYPRRGDIWSMLPDTCREKFLYSTSKAWIQSLPIRVSEAAYIAPEPELALALASLEMRELITDALQRLTFGEVHDVFLGNPNLPEKLLAAVFPTIYRQDKPPPIEEIRRCGRLVATRDWGNITRQLIQKYGATAELRDFFQICASHLGIWDQLKHGIGQPSQTDLYNVLAETACQLYSSGPMDSEIWARAGGDPAKLNVSGTGQQQWEAAIRKVRSGSRVCAADLLSTMREDYPLNERLIYLEQNLR